METKQYIASGILELYVYGLLSEPENMEVAKMAKNNSEINDEIIVIEKTIISLSSSFSPFHSVTNFDKINAKLELNDKEEVEVNSNTKWFHYLGWVAAVAFLIGIVFLYQQLEQTNTQAATSTSEKAKLEKEFNVLKLKSTTNETSLAVVRDTKNTVIILAGQAVSPESYAKIYWNNDTKKVFVDATGLPEPPKGMVYQVWALKLNPLTPTSIGLLENFDKNNQKMFAVDNATDAEAFGITLEPKGGSLTPTMEQLFVFGKV